VIKILGLDLSLTATGVAGIGWAETLRYPGTLRTCERTDPEVVKEFGHLRRRFYEVRLRERYLRGVQLAVIEGLGLGHHNTGTAELAGQSYQIRDLLWSHGIPYAVVPPTCLKRYATGNGGPATDKAAVTAAVRRYWASFDGDHNAADAAVLVAMGAHHVGWPLWPVPQTQSAALAGVVWPEIPALEAIA
jgi:hypothetical protein